MLKYAFILTRNKPAARAIVKNCLEKHNKERAWYGKDKEREAQKVRIRKACHNWLHSQVIEIIKKRNQSVPQSKQLIQTQ